MSIPAGFRVSMASLFLVLAALVGAGGCGDDEKAFVAAITQDSGRFGAMMASSEGELLLPIVSRDPLGAPTAVTGVLWMKAEEARIAVMVDAEGLPTHAVMGDLIVLFSDWNRAAGTVDLAAIFGFTQYIEVFRDVPVPGLKAGGAVSGVLTSAMTCFPTCETGLKNLSEMLKIGGTAFAIGGCIAATVGTWGAMALPCAGALVGAATLVLPDDLWLEDTENVGRALALTDALKCTRGALGECISFFNTVATEAMDQVDSTLLVQKPTMDIAWAALEEPSEPEGVIQGTAPTCPKDYECTPGAYLPCYPEGTKQCGQDCRWGDCPKPFKEPDGMTQCSDNVPTCDCSLMQACATVSMSGACVGWYKTSAGNFQCASCSDCTGAAQAVTQACCPDDD